MARSFSYTGAGTVYTTYFGSARGFIKIESVSFNESTGKITITWDLGFKYDYSSGGGLISAVAAAFGGKLYDSEKNSDNGGIYYGNYMVHPKGTVTSQQGSVLKNAGTWGGTLTYLDNRTHVIDATSSLTYGVRAQMNYGWGWTARWDSQGCYQNLTGGTLYFTLPQYDIAYSANGGSSTPSTQTKNYNSNINVAGAISRTGYTFGGWKASNGTVYSAGAAYSANASTTLTAQWNAIEYSITYNANGGSGAPGKQTYTYDSSASINLSSQTPTRTGYTFLGWSLSSTATSASYSAGQAWRRDNQSNYTLYAVWQINKYYLDVNAYLDGTYSGGLGAYGTVDVTVGGTKVAENVNDYYTQHNYGSSYSITDIRANTGYQYNGVSSGSASGTIGTSDISVALNFTTIKPTIAQFEGSATSPFSIALNWTSTGINISNYTVYYRVTNSGASSWQSLDCGTSTSATLTTTEETSYDIFVRATNPGGTGESNILVIETPSDQAKSMIYISAESSHPTIEGYKPVQYITASSLDQRIELDHDTFFGYEVELKIKWNDVQTAQNIGSYHGGYFGVANGYYTLKGEQTTMVAVAGQIDTVKLVSTFLYDLNEGREPGSPSFIIGGSRYYQTTLYVNGLAVGTCEARTSSSMQSYSNFHLFGVYGIDEGSTASIYSYSDPYMTLLPYINADGQPVFVSQDGEEYRFDGEMGQAGPGFGEWRKGKTYYKKDGVWARAKKIFIKTNDTWKEGIN